MLKLQMTWRIQAAALELHHGFTIRANYGG
jgi:hypothetical protein